MVLFHTTKINKCDDFMTPRYAWENISHLIPKKVIWEAFYGSGESGNYLTDLGFDVIHKQIDFFDNDLGEIIVTNPPFSKSQEVLKRLKQLGKPFIIILPVGKITTQYFQELFSKEDIQIIIPKKRIHFLKLVNGVVPDGWKNQCSFDCYYYCWKIELNKDITFL
tara:strand:+ start:1478 stop:1972 length:495 start_codon:yes stop_codon:yes gene_type:complete